MGGVLVTNRTLLMSKTANAKDHDSASPTCAVQPVREGSESDLNVLRKTVQVANCYGSGPSVEGVAAELIGMPPVQRASALRGLQQTIGNRYVGRLAVQAKLKIGQPGDKYEQEADRVADAVMRMPEPQAVSNGTFSIQGTCPTCEEDELRRQPIEEEEVELRRQPMEEEEELQAKATSGHISEIQPDIESHIQSTGGGGKPLSENERAFFEPRFGCDFSQVRVHADNEAAQINQKLEAQAFTHRRDIYFGSGQYNSQPTAGKRLLAHELTHTIQQGNSPIAEGQSIQRSAYRTARQRGQSGNPINVAVQAVRDNYSEIGATWLTTHLVAGIIYAEGEINTDVTDVIGDFLGTSGTVGPGQLSSAAIQQVDTSIPQAAHQQFETQFGAAPATWREKAEHDQWAFFYTAGYLAWCMSESARIFQAVDGADSHIPLGFAYYLGAYPRIRDLRRRIAREKGIDYTDVTWKMVEEAAGSGASRRLSQRERRVFEYAQLGVGGFDFEFQINRALESRSFHVPEGHVKVYCSANYTDSSITLDSGDSYYIQLLELRTTGQYSRYPNVQLVRHDRVRYSIGQRQVYEWTGLLRGSTYALEFTNENSNEISGSGEVEYLY